MSITVVDRERLDEIRKDGRPVVVDFYADWCRPCHALTPEVEQLADTFVEDVTVVKIDVDAEPRFAQELGIMSIPTVVRFDGDEEVARFVGLAPASELARKLGLGDSG